MTTSRVLDGTAQGELLVSSDTMMDGYWRRPELTAASIVHPFRDGVVTSLVSHG